MVAQRPDPESLPRRELDWARGNARLVALVGLAGRLLYGRIDGRNVPTWSNRSQLSSGFTLIELLVVIVAISLLAALVAPNVFRHVGTAKEATARSQIEMLGAALDAYRLDNGRYPTSGQGLDALWAEPVLEPRPRNWRGPYLRKKVPEDPWGNAYSFSSPGQANPNGYDLLSLGSDGAQGGEGEAADVTSWEN